MTEIITIAWAAFGGWLIGTTCLLASAHFIVAPMFFGEDGRPLRCQHCGAGWLDLKENIKDYDRSYVYETGTSCMKCGESVAYWAYGFYDPSYREDFLAEYERLAPWFGLIWGFAVGGAICLN